MDIFGYLYNVTFKKQFIINITQMVHILSLGPNSRSIYVLSWSSTICYQPWYILNPAYIYIRFC